MRPLNLYLAFDFYGAGNIGDDLMMGGLIEGLSRIAGDRPMRLVGTSPHDVASQRRRFPLVEWLDPPELARWIEAPQVRDFSWLGAGGTPFQTLSGPWMTLFLQRHAGGWSRFAQRLLANVGAEQEAARDAGDLAPVARALDRISTRDEPSAEFLRQSLGCSPDRLFVGNDLANLSLPALSDKVAGGRASPRFELGLIAASYMLARHEVEAIGSFVSESATFPIAWVASEVRLARGMERHTLQYLADRFGPEWRDRVHLLAPSYSDATLVELLDPIADCRVVLSSRYHGLLAAAWLGKRVAGFGATSKVAALARELGVPMLAGPLTTEGLDKLAEEAVQVPRERLAAMSERALRALRFTIDG